MPIVSHVVTDGGCASRLRRLGAVIRQARLDSDYPTQVQLAATIGVEQTKLSRWERGQLWPNLDELARLEDVLRLPRGDLLIRCGAVGLPTLPTEQAILADRTLSDTHRSAVLSLYRVLRQQAAAEGGKPEPRRRPRSGE